MLKTEAVTNLLHYYSSFINYDLARVYLPVKRKEDVMRHLDAAVQWLCRAQDASGDGGVARSYSLVYLPYFKKKGWIASYPETTGYIIPTMFDYAHFAGRGDIFERAVRMADWECTVQLETGAVQGGTIGEKPTPAIFNTGQVVFGWLRAFQETGRERYLASAIKAGEFLVEQQDKDGAWRKQLSDYASKKMSFYTYNTRTAWALLLLARAADNGRFKDSAIRNIDFALNQQLDNGWFPSNCLNDPSQPLLHTIAYAIRGILEAGVLLENQTYIQKAQKAADALIKQQRCDGSLAGRFNNRWEATVSWSCLTGDAQTAIIWARLHQITGKQDYFERMKKINRFLMSVQFLGTKNADIFGGIGGSCPLHGEYGKFEVLNWAVKFFIDALMLETSIQENNRS